MWWLPLAMAGTQLLGQGFDYLLNGKRGGGQEQQRMPNSGAIPMQFAAMAMPNTPGTQAPAPAPARAPRQMFGQNMDAAMQRAQQRMMGA